MRTEPTTETAFANIFDDNNWFPCKEEYGHAGKQFNR